MARAPTDQGDLDITAHDSDSTVSVVMCTFDGARYLPQQLESITTQSRTPNELIVCDDGSSDRTIQLIEEFARSATFPVLVHQNRLRLGPSANFDQGLGLAQHEFVALCDQDDVWSPSRLERQVEALTGFPSAAICFSDAEIVDADSIRTGQRIWERVDCQPPSELWTADEMFRVLLRHPVVTGATLMIRRSLLEHVRPIASNWLHDEWIALIATAGGSDAIAISEPLIEYRMHDDQHTGLNIRRLNLEAVRSGRRPISMEAERSGTLLERLRSLPHVRPDLLGLAEARHVHLTGRQQAVRSTPLGRAGRIARLARSGDYRRFSNGWTSALADLAGRTRDLADADPRSDR